MTMPQFVGAIQFCSCHLSVAMEIRLYIVEDTTCMYFFPRLIRVDDMHATVGSGVPESLIEADRGF